ncbi:MAG: UvrD-helicase domain-containing protein [Myxococcota bacterium]
MMDKTPEDYATRRQLLEDLDGTFVVEAAAGTGKTTVLVGRIVAVVRTGRAKLSEIIAVTFTEKAAGEMKLRLRVALERERDKVTDAQERRRLTEALEALEIARIGTIHGLCADFLREYPVEAEVDPRFEVISEGDAEALLSLAFHRQLQDVLRDPPEGIRRVLRRRPKGRDDEPPRRVLFSAVQQLVEHRDFAAPWRKDPFDRDAEIDALLPRLGAFAERARQVTSRPDDSPLGDCLDAVRRFSDDLAHREAVSPRDYDGLEAQLRELAGNQRRWTWKPYGVRFQGVTNDTVAAERAELYERLQGFVRKADAHLAACLHAELLPVVAAYEAEKARVGALDFVDLLIKTRDLVRDCRPVRESLQRRFTHLFVDEFQDTDPLQSELVMLLAADDPSVDEPFEVRPVPGKLFVVGDPKQSIYRFRRADVLLYERVKRHLASHGATVVYLSTSFRSTPGIQAAVNGAFERVMELGNGLHPAYVHLGRWRDGYDKQPSVVALSPARVFNERGWVTKDQVETSLPDTVGAFIAWLIRKSGWTVEEDGQRVPVEPRHVCILFKRLRRWGGVDIPRPYAQALEARGVPHVLVGGRSFHVREEVMALRTALMAVERPDDELSVYAALRGPFFALSDEQLLIYRHEVGHFHPLRPLEGLTLSEDAAAVGEALGVLRELHVARNRRPVSATLHALLEATRAHAGIAFWSAGAQALANVLQLAEVARRLERRSTSFRDVVEALQDEADEGESPEAPIVEEGTEGVRMMTVHAAKGLEFPVVILAEPTANANRMEPSHWVDPERGLWVHALAGCLPVELREHEDEVRARDHEESVRITYVATTRAKDLLVIPAVGDKRWPDTWTEVLYPSVYPPEGSAHDPKPAPGCPELGHDVLVDREGAVPPHVPLPGLHRTETGKNRVVWWGPKPLELDLEATGGLQNSDALEEAGSASEEGRRAWEDWRLTHARALQEGGRPSERVRVARELEEPPPPGLIALEDSGVPREGRPKGRRFGELVHAVLAVVPLDASRALVTNAVAAQGRALLSSAAEQSAAVEAVLAALAHPLMQAARSAQQVRRERGIVDVLAPGDFVEGSIDLAWRDAHGWTVVEFKTDEDLDAHRQAYEAQAAAYVRAVQAATGLPTRGVLFRV